MGFYPILIESIQNCLYALCSELADLIHARALDHGVDGQLWFSRNMCPRCPFVDSAAISVGEDDPSIASDSASEVDADSEYVPSGADVGDDTDAPRQRQRGRRDGRKGKAKLKVRRTGRRSLRPKAVLATMSARRTGGRKDKAKLKVAGGRRRKAKTVKGAAKRVKEAAKNAGKGRRKKDEGCSCDGARVEEGGAEGG